MKSKPIDKPGRFAAPYPIRLPRNDVAEFKAFVKMILNTYFKKS